MLRLLSLLGPNSLGSEAAKNKRNSRRQTKQSRTSTVNGKERMKRQSACSSLYNAILSRLEGASEADREE